MAKIVSAINWVPIESRVLAAAAYVSGERLLYLRFNSGEVYRYFDFPPEQYDDLLSAESKGQYLNSHIRDGFPCERLPRSFQAGR